MAAALLALAGCGSSEPDTPIAQLPPAQRPTPSGYPVPRWLTLKFGEVNGRAGPGDEHRTLWVYRTKGLPVQVVAETREWRRICDPDGGLAWIHERTTTGVRNALNRGAEAAPIHAKPSAGSPVKGYLATGALAKLDECEGSWCRVEAGKVKGWAPAASLWGSAETAGCNAPPRR